ncbi:hypothetical protein KIN20_002259 [Parelaphostrongylus tenuis]|uniref:Uncharacterized protein n=1 Tax=Parelaphostrongylus tenuis TaxID=148309 RepID=A0AAD5MDX8_PARTN|nr:hypothetical protein KIN20_002259 [Parelaphostrongylus tenuis]
MPKVPHIFERIERNNDKRTEETSTSWRRRVWSKCCGYTSNLISTTSKMSAYDRAKKVYERIQEEKARERILRQQEREQRHLSLQKYLESKKKRNKVLRKCNKKGQPNLGAQVEILLEKLEKEDK